MAKYPRPLCRAVLRGLTAQFRADGRLLNGCYGLQLPDEVPLAKPMVQKFLYGPAQGYSGKYKDDLTGQTLRDNLVLEARVKELKFFADKQVWIKVPRQRAHQRTGKPPISVRWVDTNKADEEEPNYRSRLVARQLKACDSSGASYFAPAPPLEALRTIISLAMTRCGSHQRIWDPDSPQRQQIRMFGELTSTRRSIEKPRPASSIFFPKTQIGAKCAESSYDICTALVPRRTGGRRSTAHCWYAWASRKAKAARMCFGTTHGRYRAPSTGTISLPPVQQTH